MTIPARLCFFAQSTRAHWREGVYFRAKKREIIKQIFGRGCVPEGKDKHGGVLMVWTIEGQEVIKIGKPQALPGDSQSLTFREIWGASFREPPGATIIKY